MNTEKKEIKKSTKIIITVAVIVLLIGGYYGLNLYKTYFAPNVNADQKYLYIKTGSNYEDLLANLQSKGILKDAVTFQAAAAKMNLLGNVKSGRYRLKEGLNNRALINMIKAGNQDPVKLKFQNIRKKENFAAYMAKNMEADSLAFISVLDSRYWKNMGLTKRIAIPCLSQILTKCIGTSSQLSFLKGCKRSMLSFGMMNANKKPRNLISLPYK
jgi:UPF0755 protein